MLFSMARKLRRTDCSEPESPFCTTCGGADLMRGGVANGKRRFRCRTCNKWSYGEPLPVPLNRFPCPYCGGRCGGAGLSENGRQRYQCHGCGKKNTDLYPEPPPDPDGPFPYLVTLNLDTGAYRGLLEYGHAHGMSPAQTARAVFRQAGREPSVVIGSARRLYGATTGVPRGRVVVTSPPQENAPVETPTPFPDARQAATGRRMRGSVGIGGHRACTVYGVVLFGVALDALAWQGLARTVRKLGGAATHQDAARFLLAQARNS